MFPPLDLAKIQINQTNKTALFSLDSEKKDIISFRYYGIKIEPAGINKKIRNLLNQKKIPNLNKFSDIS